MLTGKNRRKDICTDVFSLRDSLILWKNVIKSIKRYPWKSQRSGENQKLSWFYWIAGI